METAELSSRSLPDDTEFVKFWNTVLAPKFIRFKHILVGGLTLHSEAIFPTLPVREGDRVLDVGCGTGNLSFALAESPDIEGICGLDRSAEYVDYAERRNRDVRLGFRVGDACQLPFPDASFSHTLSMLVLQFIPRVVQMSIRRQEE